MSSYPERQKKTTNRKTGKPTPGVLFYPKTPTKKKKKAAVAEDVRPGGAQNRDPDGGSGRERFAQTSDTPLRLGRDKKKETKKAKFDKGGGGRALTRKEEGLRSKFCAGKTGSRRAPSIRNPGTKPLQRGNARAN